MDNPNNLPSDLDRKLNKMVNGFQGISLPSTNEKAEWESDDGSDASFNRVCAPESAEPADSPKKSASDLERKLENMVNAFQGLSLPSTNEKAQWESGDGSMVCIPEPAEPSDSPTSVQFPIPEVESTDYENQARQAHVLNCIQEFFFQVARELLYGSESCGALLKAEDQTKDSREDDKDDNEKTQ
ncbi:hypothetical protein KR018_009156 [Drosophila ironensis]|nr:hypothetical protein KR018_009156 [Drosophila ironensis]